MDEPNETAHKRAVADKWLAKIAGVPDEQKLYVSCMSHSSGDTTSHAITARQFRERLAAAVGDEEYVGVLIKFDDDGQYDLDYHDYYSVTVATPDVEAAIAAEEEDDRTINELIRCGVDRKLFFHSGTADEWKQFTAAEVLAMSKIVVAYFASRRPAVSR